MQFFWPNHLSLPVEGVEVAGTIHDVSNSVPNSNFTLGDRIILFPNEDLADSGYAEYLAIDDTRQIMQVPRTVPLEVAAMLPGGALSAYAAVLAAKPHIEKLQQVKCKKHSEFKNFVYCRRPFCWLLQNTSLGA